MTTMKVRVPRGVKAIHVPRGVKVIRPPRPRAIRAAKPRRVRMPGSPVLPSAPRVPRIPGLKPPRVRTQNVTRRTATNATRIRSAKVTSPAGAPNARTFVRTGVVNTKGGLHRTARLQRTVTGTGANRVVKTRRVITRVKNGRTVKRVVTRVNNGGNVQISMQRVVTPSAQQVHRRIRHQAVTNPGVKHSPVTGGSPAHQARNGGTAAPAAAAAQVTNQRVGLNRAKPARRNKRKR